MSDSGGDWWQKIGGAAGLAALAGVVLDKFRTWTKDNKDSAIKIDEIQDKQATELWNRRETYIASLEKRVTDLQQENDNARLKTRNAESQASFVGRENQDMRDLIHRIRAYSATMPPDIKTEIHKYDDDKPAE